MNDFVKRINDISVANMYKLHDILEQSLVRMSEIWPNIEIRFNQDNGTFVTKIDDYFVVVIRDMNTFTLNVKIIADGDVTVAECSLSTTGVFNEKYSRMPSSTKASIFAWFNRISEIDCNILTTGPVENDSSTPVEVESEPEEIKEEVEAKEE